MKFPLVETLYPATRKDVEAAPADRITELLRGTMYVHRMPPPIHSHTRTVLLAQLVRAFYLGLNGPGGYWIQNLPEFYLGEDVLVPDIAGIRRERLPELPEIRFSLAPDWVCEVLSTSTEFIDRQEKMPIYAREGVQHAWLVNPIQRFLEVYELQSGHWLRLATYANDAHVRVVPFDAIELELRLLWA